MREPVKVSQLLKLSRYLALALGVGYGAKRYNHLKPKAEEERRRAAEKKKRNEELKQIERQLSKARDESIIK